MGFSAPAGAEVQLRQDDLQEVLRPPPPQGHQLQEEGVRSHLPAETQEEAEVSCSPLPDDTRSHNTTGNARHLNELCSQYRLTARNSSPAFESSGSRDLFLRSMN